MKGFFKLNNDGTIQSANTQLDGSWRDLSLLETKEDGSYYSYYKEDLTPNLEKIMKEEKQNLLNQVEQSIQDYIDNEAKQRGYDNIVSACSYAGYENPYQEEAIKLGKFRSDCWSKAYEIQNDVEVGNRPMPTIDEIIEELPNFEDY